MIGGGSIAGDEFIRKRRENGEDGNEMHGQFSLPCEETRDALALALSWVRVKVTADCAGVCGGGICGRGLERTRRKPTTCWNIVT